jgi:hypothetical protein
MEINIFFYIAALLGVAFHLMMKFRDAFTKSEKFNWKYQLTLGGFSLVTVLFFVFFRASAKDYLPAAFINLDAYFTWALIGYFIDSIWKNTEKGIADKIG